jgi:negative regulator of sigma E activity
MRRRFAGVDTSDGFEARVLARVAALPAVPEAVLRIQADRRQELARRRLRREAWLNGVTTVGVGAAVMALVWRHGAAVAGWTEQAMAAISDADLLARGAAVVLAACLWPAVRRLLPR